jgi:hypothetical protein
MKFLLAAAAIALSACSTVTLPGGAGSMGLRVEPHQYSPAMSSTPGIGFTTVFIPPSGTTVNYHWTANFGYFVTWNAPNYAVVPRGADFTATEGRVYWTYDPRFIPDRKPTVTITVSAEDAESGRIVARRAVKLDWERDTARLRD